jgi:hypothetical protein
MTILFIPPQIQVGIHRNGPESATIYNERYNIKV